MSDEPLRDACDVAVVGAGPAGLAAASLCARHGLATILLDEQAAPGGQMYRSITRTPLRDREVLGEAYWRGEKLATEFLASGARYLAGARVEAVTPELELRFAANGETQSARALRVIVASGAVERPFAIPGRERAGVEMLGVAQARLKDTGEVAHGRVVIAGSGPILWQAAAQQLAAGATVEAILDTTPRANRAAAQPHIVGYFMSPYFRPMRRLMRTVRGAARVVAGIEALRAEGGDALEAVAYRTADGAEGRLAADTLLLHMGTIPNVELLRAAGAELRWDDVQLCEAPLLDAQGTTTVPGLAVAGDAAGIAGGQAAAWRGVIIGMAAVRALRPATKLPVERLAFTALHRFLRGRAYLDRRYRPAEAFRVAAAPSP